MAVQPYRRRAREVSDAPEKIRAAAGAEPVHSVVARAVWLTVFSDNKML